MRNQGESGEGKKNSEGKNESRINRGGESSTFKGQKLRRSKV